MKYLKRTAVLLAIMFITAGFMPGAALNAHAQKDGGETQPEPDKNPLNKAVIEKVKDQTYTGTALKPALKIMIGGRALKSGVDYKVVYISNVNAGTARAAVTGIGQYEGSMRVSFRIKPRTITGSMTARIPKQAFSSKGSKPVPKIIYNKKVLKAGKDFAVSYKNNRKAGTGTAVVRGRGNYTGTVSKAFKIITKVTVKKKLVSKSKYRLKSPKLLDVKYITVHNTANDAPAAREISYMTDNKKSTSFHFAADEKGILQGIPEERIAFHSGTRTGNMTSISIEICYSRSGGSRFLKAEDNAAKLAADLLNKYHLPISRLRTHKSWSGKNCPARTMKLGWQRFVNKVKGYMSDPGTRNTALSGTVPAKNSVYTVGGIKYRVTNPSILYGTVQAAGVNSKFVTSASLPSSIKLMGYTYKVNSIGANAFDGCGKLKNLKIQSAAITSVGSNAFRGIYGRAVIKIPAAKYSAYQKLFKGKGQGIGVKIVKM